jgi:hypothetical protein
MFSFSQFSIRSRVDCFLILKVVPILNPVEKNLIRTHSTTQNTHQNQLNELRQHLPKQVFHHLQFDCLQKRKRVEELKTIKQQQQHQINKQNNYIQDQ